MTATSIRSMFADRRHRESEMEVRTIRGFDGRDYLLHEDWTQGEVHEEAPHRGPQLMALVAGIVVLAIVIIARFYR